VPFHITKTDIDQHVEIELPVSTASATLRLKLKNDFGLSYDNALPALGAPSSALRIVSESWNDAHTQLTLSVAGIPGQHYALRVWNPAQIATVDGAPYKTKEPGTLAIDFPAQPTPAFVTRSIVLTFPPATR
jgi:hypothetical protein